MPRFGPLKEKNNRPAIQIRQMGTLPEARRKGFAAEVLANLETESRAHFGAKFGFTSKRAIILSIARVANIDILTQLTALPS